MTKEPDDAGPGTPPGTPADRNADKTALPETTGRHRRAAALARSAEIGRAGAFDELLDKASYRARALPFSTAPEAGGREAESVEGVDHGDAGASDVGDVAGDEGQVVNAGRGGHESVDDGRRLRDGAHPAPLVGDLHRDR